MAMILIGNQISAPFGLVSEIVLSADLDAAALRWAEKVTAASPLAKQATKAAVISKLNDPLQIALATKFEPIEGYAASIDRCEGEAAAKERRKPVWTGR